ncbi:hypothetical protein BDW62DRAFT_64539 [Aspergillus aurantiobrunneus]
MKTACFELTSRFDRWRGIISSERRDHRCTIPGFSSLVRGDGMASAADLSGSSPAIIQFTIAGLDLLQRLGIELVEAGRPSQSQRPTTQGGCIAARVVLHTSHRLTRGRFQVPAESSNGQRQFLPRWERESRYLKRLAVPPDSGAGAAGHARKKEAHWPAAVCDRKESVLACLRLRSLLGGHSVDPDVIQPKDL